MSFFDSVLTVARVTPIAEPDFRSSPPYGARRENRWTWFPSRQRGELRSVGGVGCPVDAWNVGACEGDGGAVDEGVGLVWGAVEEGLLEQVFKGAFGVKVALEVSVEAIGDVGGVGVLGACKVGDGFACGGEEFGEGELLVGAFGFGLWC
jgi:hypothetical protein